MLFRHSSSFHIAIWWCLLLEGIMFRVIACAAFLLSGCARDPPTAPAVKIATKIVRQPFTEIKTRTCRITMIVDTDVCRTKKTCGEIETCAEAYYRYTTCGDFSLDARPLGSNVPPPEGQPNGIPCEQQLRGGRPGCGKTALNMAAKIRSEPPFSPFKATDPVCDPA
jgi:hypothetical protein